MSRSKRKCLYNQNIIDALNKLPKVMLNYKGNKVLIKPRSERETGKEHIAKSYHGLKVKDIQNIPKTLLKPYKSKQDPHYKSKQNYYSLRRGEVGRGLLLKIVTEKNKDGTELIDTVFTTNKIK